MDVPTELLTMVFRNLSKAELKLCRLVCKPLNRVAIPLLFDEVFLSTNRADFEVARLTVKHFGSYIRKLVFSSVVYPVIEWDERQERWFDAIDLEHLKLSHRNYCRLQKEQQHDINSGAHLAHLCSAMQGSPNLRSIDLRDFGSHYMEYGAPKRGRGFWHHDEVCRIRDCSLSDDEHFEERYQPISGFLSIPGNPWQMAMLAIRSTKRNITEVTIETDPDPDWQLDVGLPFSYSTRAIEGTSYYTHMFSKLTRLELVLCLQDAADAACYEDRSVARALSLDNNLKSLSITIWIRNYDPTPGQSTKLQACLSGCQFPKLRSLGLFIFDSTSTELAQFLSSLPDLERLHCGTYWLKAGTWEPVADWIRANIKLKDISFDRLVGGWTGAFADKDPLLPDFEYREMDKAVEEFFFHDGRNPFSEAALRDNEDARKRSNEKETGLRRY